MKLASALPRLAAAGLLMLATMCGVAQTPAPVVTDAQLATSLARSFGARYTQLERQAADLQSALDALCAEPSSATRLETARTAWRAAARTIRVIEVWPLGPTLERRSLRRFDFWPTRPPQIEAAVAEQTQGTLDLTRVGVTAQGLPALEYLLFDNAPKNPPILSAPAHCAYARLIAADFGAEAVALRTAWSEWTPRGALAFEADKATALLADTINILVGVLDQMRTRKLQKPAAATTTPNTAWDAWRSGATREHLLANLDGVRIVLMGDADNIGLLALLRGRGQLALASQLDKLLVQADDAVRALPTDLRGANPKTVAPAVAALGRLQETLAADTAEALRITMGFNDSDGD